MKKLSVFTAILSLLCCQQPVPKTKFSVREYTRITDEGFEDIRLSVTSVERTPTHTVVTALSTANKDTLGVIVHIPVDATDEKGFGKGLVLERSGVASDNLLKLLAGFYEVPVPPNAQFTERIMSEYVDLDAFALAAAGTNNKQPELFKSKLFLGDEDGETAEFFLNINFSEHWLEIKEKDNEYRQGIIRLLQNR